MIRKAEEGVNHFRGLFQEQRRANIAKIIKVASYFPRILKEEQNEALEVEVKTEELKAVLYSFQKGKIPGTDGWTAKCYTGYIIF